MEVRDMVKQHLKGIGADGLAGGPCGECGCALDDLFSCERFSAFYSGHLACVPATLQPAKQANSAQGARKGVMILAPMETKGD